ncbi:MAG: UDP-N-acetylmuramate--L-alanine ligase, partial [Flavobacteriia bacterium]|nr:UDP-N-acetylmuramate--L-alanine ligase [Flavobacteriia bacterium]
MMTLNSHMVFIGIGGIGMSALARHCLRQGKPVFGYDKVRTELTSLLESEGAIITYEENIQSYPGWAPEDTTVVFTPAIQKTNAWMSFFSTFSPIKRAEALAGIANEKRCLAVAGTHGKTSTSALLTHILSEAGQDPTAFIGGIMSGTKTNYRLGNGPWVVVEADEFDRSFLHL